MVQQAIFKAWLPEKKHLTKTRIVCTIHARVMERLSPETIELAQSASYTHIKDIVKSEHVQITEKE
jgi:hypothetical protein